MIVCLCFLVIGITQMKLSVVLYLLINYFFLNIDHLFYGVKYLMVLEYLVGQQYEKLNLMEVEDYQEVCLLSIYYEILVFYTFRIVISTEGDAWP